MAKNVQDTVFEIIKFARQSGLPSIRKAQIMDEVRKTPLEKYDHEHFKNHKCTKLDDMISQAISQLKKNKRIKKRGKGWTVDKDATPYKPVICKHLTEDERGYYCPVKKVYIGSPREQCELLHGSVFTGKGWVKGATPMCPGYTNRTSTKVSREYAKKAIDKQNKERDDAFNKAVSRRGK